MRATDRSSAQAEPAKGCARCHTCVHDYFVTTSCKAIVSAPGATPGACRREIYWTS